MKKVALWETDGIAVIVHGILVVGPIISSSLTVARFVAAERALAILKDPESKKCLAQICNCAQAMAIDDIAVIDSLIVGDEMLFVDPLDGSPSDIEDIAEVDSILSHF